MQIARICCLFSTRTFLCIIVENETWAAIKHDANEARATSTIGSGLGMVCSKRFGIAIPL